MRRYFVIVFTLMFLLSTAVAPSMAAGLIVKASVAKPTIKQNSKQTVTVVVVNAKKKPVSGATGTLTVEYKTKDSIYAIPKTNSKGVAQVSFRIGRATKGFKVICVAKMKKGKLTGTGSTSFVAK